MTSHTGLPQNHHHPGDALTLNPRPDYGDQIGWLLEYNAAPVVAAQPTQVPEPCTFWLSAALLLAGLMVRRRKQSWRQHPKQQTPKP